jgi:DNA-binding Lrp family transcriptional regulator
MPNPRIDETDRRILRYLLRDARQPVAVLARQIGLSESAVRHRIDRLAELEVIRRFTVALDCKKLGYRCPIHGRLGHCPKGSIVGSCFLGEHLAFAMHLSPLAGVYRLRPTGGDTGDGPIWVYEHQQLTTPSP